MKALTNLFSTLGFLLLTTIIFVSIAPPVHAQVDTATLTGSVTDAQGSVVPGAQVRITNQATNITAEANAGEDGYYTFTNLRPGRYTIAVEQAGFKREERTDLELNIGQRARLDLALTIGAVDEVVTITSESLALNREEASLGNVVDNQRITTLPLPQRAWDDLISQVAGAQGDPYTEQGGGTAPAGRTGAVSIHGVNSQSNNFILDGQDNNTISTNVQELALQVSRPSVDAIGEFKVITSQYSADTGRAMGGVISVTTRSGTNDFHGLLYEYARNKVFDANDFFSNKFAREKPQRNQHQFGGNFGGPIFLPRFGEGGPALFKGRDRAFFFMDYEDTIIRLGQVRVATVPLMAERVGDFSGRLGNEILVSGQRVPILNPDGTPSGQFVRQNQLFDPRTQVPNPRFDASQRESAFNPRFIRQPFANNIITNIDPTANRLVGFYPVQNQPGNRNNFVRTPSLIDDNTRFTTRLDFKLNDNNDLFGRYSYTARDRFVPGFFGGIADSTDTSAWGQNYIKSHSITIGFNSVLTPTIINQFRFGYSRSNAEGLQEPFGQGSSSDYIPGVPNNAEVQGGLPAILVQGFNRLGSADFHPKFQNSQQYQFTDTVSLTRGSHTFRFGTDVLAPIQLDYLDVPNTRSRLFFNGAYTGFAGGLSGTGNAFADFLVGHVYNAALTNTLVVNQRRHMYSFFGQDDWKVTPRLTVNLGLRYDFGSPAYEANDRQTNFDQTAAARARTPAEALAAIQLASDGSLEDRTLQRPDRMNFAPRVGFAFSPTDRTVVRGGYGIYYNLIDRFGSEDQTSLNAPFVTQFDFTSDIFNPAITFSSGFAPNTLDPSTLDPRKLLLRSFNPDAKTPYIQQGSLSIQHQFGRDYIAELSYVTSKGTHLMVLRNLNLPSPGLKPPTINDPNPAIAVPARAQFFPYPAFGVVQYRDDLGISKYHSMEATLDKRFSRGFTTRAAYTFSKSLDNVFDFAQDQRDYSTAYGPSGFDVRHRLVINGIWELPFGRGRAYLNEGIGSAILGGWELSGVFNTRSGLPYTVTQGGDPLQLGGRSTTLPDVVGDPHLDNPTIDRWFDPTAFQRLPVNGTRFGNAGRNILYGPDFAALNLGIHRRFNLGSETRYLDFRWELFNALNRANFGRPNGDINSSSVGTITTLSGDPRVMQFAFRLSF